MTYEEFLTPNTDSMECISIDKNMWEPVVSVAIVDCPYCGSDVEVESIDNYFSDKKTECQHCHREFMVHTKNKAV